VEIGRAQEVEERFHRTTMISMGSISRCDSPDSWEYYFTSEPPPAYRRSIGHLAEALDTRIGINAEARLTRRPHPILRS
jgi:hypothetical protein